MQLCDIVAPCRFLLICHLLCTFTAHFAMHVVSCLTAHSLLLYHIEFFTEFSLYFILLILISSYRLLKKGSTSPHTIIHFAGSSHCKCITVLHIQECHPVTQQLPRAHHCNCHHIYTFVDHTNYLNLPYTWSHTCSLLHLSLDLCIVVQHCMSSWF